MFLRVLGSAAGGGCPQWNCACSVCERARRGDGVIPRTQASLAVRAEGGRFLLLAASPDVRRQLELASALWPTADAVPIAGVALPNGDVDAWVGLLSLREWAPLEIFATARVRRDLLEHNEVMRTLERFEGQSRWRELVPGQPIAASGLSLTALPVRGQAPLHAASRRAPDALDNVAFRVREEATGRSIVWCPTAGAPDAALERLIDDADAVFFDGTFWTDDELVRAGRGQRRARDMGHWPLSGPEGSLPWLAARRAGRRFLVHVNNTNPVLIDAGPERARVRAAGLEVAHDGLELSLWIAPDVPEAFVERLRSEGRSRYHDEHPFHRAMHEGRLGADELRRWVTNRYYYQTRIPIKDALILAKSEDAAFRRRWSQRITDHDGAPGGDGSDGGLELWRKLALATGVSERELDDPASILPGVRFACDAYVELVRRASLVEAVASSLTEAFAPDLMQRRIVAWEQHYAFVDRDALDYFRTRVPRARRDAEDAIAFVVEHARTRDEQDRCVAALVVKTQILWHLLDCVSRA